MRGDLVGVRRGFLGGRCVADGGLFLGRLCILGDGPFLRVFVRGKQLLSGVLCLVGRRLVASGRLRGDLVGVRRGFLGGRGVADGRLFLGGGRGQVHHDLHGVHELTHRLVVLLVVGVAELVVDGSHGHVDELHLIVEADHQGRGNDRRDATQHDVAVLGDGEDFLGGADLDGLAVHQDLGIGKVAVGPVHGEEQLLPRDAVGQGKGGLDPAVFLVFTNE